MALESATYLNQLVATNPTATDPVGQGDDHTRLIKSTLLATFPNFTAVALNSTQAQIDSAVAAAGVAANVPTGGVLMFGGSSAPAGYLLCNGQSVSTTTYATLYGVIGYTYGGSAGTMHVPNFTGRTPRGVDASATVLNATTNVFNTLALGGVGGEATHALASGELAAHTHSITDPGHTHTVSVTDPGHTHGITDPGHNHAAGTSTYFLMTAGGSVYAYAAASGPAALHSVGNDASTTTGITNNSATTGITAAANSNTTGITAASTGSGTAHNTVGPTLLVNFIIKT